MALRVSTSGAGRGSTPAVKVAVAAVALSVAVMLAAIAVVTGFKQEITRRVTGFNPHIVLKANQALSNGEYLSSMTQGLEEVLGGAPYIRSYTLAANAPAIFKTGEDFKGVYLRSIQEAGEETPDSPEREFVEEMITEGRMPDFRKEPLAVAVSETAARQLRLQPGDTLPTYFVLDQVSVRPLTVAGIYNSHFSSYDDIYAFAALPFIQEMGGVGRNEGTSVSIYVDDFSKVAEYAADLRQRLDRAYATGLIYRYYDIETALTSGANFFSWLELLDTNVAVIIALMTAVALITLISGMLILRIDKQEFIEIMTALGASQGLLRRIFVWLTLRVALTGMLIGNAVMLILLAVQERTHFLPLDADSYYIDFVPVHLTAPALILLNAGVLGVTYLVLSLFRMPRRLRRA